MDSSALFSLGFKHLLLFCLSNEIWVDIWHYSVEFSSINIHFVVCFEIKLVISIGDSSFILSVIWYMNADLIREKQFEKKKTKISNVENGLTIYKFKVYKKYNKSPRIFFNCQQLSMTQWSEVASKRIYYIEYGRPKVLRWVCIDEQHNGLCECVRVVHICTYWKVSAWAVEFDILIAPMTHSLQIQFLFFRVDSLQFCNIHIIYASLLAFSHRIITQISNILKEEFWNGSCILFDTNKIL